MSLFPLRYVRTTDVSRNPTSNPARVHHGGPFNLGPNPVETMPLADDDLTTGIVVCSTETLGVPDYGASAVTFRLDKTLLPTTSRPTALTVTYATRENLDLGGLGLVYLVGTRSDQPPALDQFSQPIPSDDVILNTAFARTTLAIYPDVENIVVPIEDDPFSDYDDDWSALNYIHFLPPALTAHNEGLVLEVTATYDGIIDTEQPVVRLYPRDDGRGVSPGRRQYPPSPAQRPFGGYL